MHITKNNLEKLVKQKEYDPEEIGIAILRTLGYKVEKYFLDGSIAVNSKDGKKLLKFFDSGVYID